MNIGTRLNSVERARARLCARCGGPVVPASPPRLKTWRAIAEAFKDLPDEERISFYSHQNMMDRLSPFHQDIAYRMSCQQRGVPYEYKGAVYSDPNPPPAPWFPDE